LTQVGALVGTLPYMAPEQLRGDRADARSDVWALGVMLHEMAAGVRPFQGRTGLELSSAILHKPPAQLPETVPLGLRTAIGRCLEKEPERRYQRAGEVHAVLEASQTGATPPRAAQRPPLDRRGWLTLARPWFFLAVVAASAAALGVGWWAVNKPASPVHRIESLVVLSV
jgi:serine/threonine protein kinase